MSELSIIGKIIKALETKQAGVGVEFSKFDVIELLGHIKSLEEEYELIKSELKRLENAWLVDEKVQADGSLRPSLTDTIKRAEKAERELAELREQTSGKSCAPWSEEQVDLLEKWQDNPKVHPFTCVCGESLTPYKDGWECDYCGHTQNWCHNFMLEKLEVE